MVNITVEQAVMGYAIKYERLKELVAECFKNSRYANSNTVNIFIDITKMIRSISYNGVAELSNDKLALSANLLNLCAHYRSFFRRGYNVESNIYLLYSTGNFFINRMYCPNYRFTDNYSDSKIVKTNLDMISLICPYLYNVDFVVTEEEVTNVLTDISISTTGVNTPNIFITKDIFSSTIAGSGVAFVFKPKKVNGSDISYAITEKNILSQYQIDRKVKPVEVDGLNPGLISFILAFTRIPERNIKNQYNIGTIIKLISKAISDGRMLNASVSDPLFTAGILNSYKPGIDSYRIQQMYRAVNLYDLYNLYKFGNFGSYKGMVNLTDIDKINEISEKYYTINRVDFPTLL